MRLALALTVLLAGCAVTSRLPHPETGRCHSVTYHPPLGWGYALGDAVDGWRCDGIADGDLAKTEKKTQ